MRVLHVVEGNLPNVDTRAAVRAKSVIRAQLGLGFDPRVLSIAAEPEPVPGSADDMEDIRVERSAFVPASGLEPATWRDRALFFHRTSRRVRRLVSREGLHLVHVYGHPTVALAALLGGHRAEVPVVYEPRVEDPRPDHLPGWVLGGFDAVVTPSRELSESWAARTRRIPIHYVPDGIETERLRDPTPLPAEPRFVVAPILEVRPSLDWLQAALSRRPELRRRVKLAVAFPEDRDRLRIAWGLRVDQVHYFAPTLDALADELDASTGLLFLADAPMGTPVEILEAAARARAVVARSSAGAKELVRDGPSGWLVDPHDERGLAEALAAASAHAATAGPVLRADAVRSRAWEVIAESYFEIYDRARHAPGLGGTLSRWAERWAVRLGSSRTRRRAPFRS